MKRITALIFGATCSAIIALAGPLGFQQINLVSDIPALAANTDSHLKNPWGMAFSGTSFIWVSDQGTNTSTLYNGGGGPQALVVSVNTVASPPNGPTGVVFNPVPADFNGDAFIFANLNGEVNGWRPALGTTTAVEVAASTDRYTGIALANDQLYIANFAGGIDVYDNAFHSITLAGNFTDPNLPAGFAPYNVQAIGGKLYVAYAQPGAGGAVEGAGLGVVDVFNLDGTFSQRLVNNGPTSVLNAPWGFALAPTGFGQFAGDLLIGNFGDGSINAFNPSTGAFLGTVADKNGNPILNDGLWGIAFGNGSNGTSPTTLYFNAGINNEADGLFGAIVALPEPGTFSLTLAAIAICGWFGVRARRKTAA